MEPDPSLVGVPGVDLASYPLEGEVAGPGQTADGPSEAVATEEAEEAYVAFYRSRRDRVARALALTLGDGSLAAEAADEAMARAYQRWHRVGSFQDPAGWAYRVGLNWACSVLRRRRRAPQPPVDRHQLDVGPVAEPAVRAALAELDVRQRAVVVCRFYLGLSERETAEALGTRPGTVKSRLHRALRHLQTTLHHLRPEECQ